jgi:ubiquinone/menaquinone biosynthesis C-methylase UbiE
LGLYERHILPHVIDRACGSGQTSKQRAKVVPEARGRVLEIGAGSGLNLPFYDPQRVERLWALEPSEGMRHKAEPRLRESALDVEWIGASGEGIPMDDATMDTVVVTFTLCTIPDPGRALAEMRRVLKPTGALLFAEHGAAPDEAVRKWQRWLNPFWRRVGGGCHLDRDIPALIEGHGFAIERIEAGYQPKTPRFAGFNFVGAARSR